MKRLSFGLLIIAALTAAPAIFRFTGVVTDSM
jgi:hypothetical protein